MFCDVKENSRGIAHCCAGCCRHGSSSWLRQEVGVCEDQLLVVVRVDMILSIWKRFYIVHIQEWKSRRLAFVKGFSPHQEDLPVCCCSWLLACWKCDLLKMSMSWYQVWSSDLRSWSWLQWRTFDIFTPSSMKSSSTHRPCVVRTANRRWLLQTRRRALLIHRKIDCAKGCKGGLIHRILKTENYSNWI